MITAPPARDADDSRTEAQRSVGAAALGRVGVVLTGLVTTMLATRLLSAADAGAFFVLSSLATGALVLTLPGLNRVAVSQLAAAGARGDVDEQSAIVRTARRTAGLSSLLLALLVLTPWGRSALATVTSRSVSWLLVLAVALLILIRTLGTLNSTLLLGMRRYLPSSVLNGADAGLLACLVMLGVLLTGGTLSLAQALLLTSLAWLPGAIWGWHALRLPRSRPRNAAPQALHRRMAAVVVSNLAGFLREQGVVLMAGALLAGAGAAQVGASARLMLVVSAPGVMIAVALQPAVARLWASGRTADMEQLVRGAAAVAAVPAVLALLLLAIGGGPVMAVLFGEPYRSAGPVVATLAVGQLVNVGVGATALLLTMCGRESDYMLLSLASALLLLAVLAPASALWGARGMAAVTAGCIALHNIGGLILVRRRLGIWSLPSISDGIAMLHVRRGLPQVAPT